MFKMQIREVILSEICQSRFILEHDISRFVHKNIYSKNFSQGLAAGLVKRMDVNQDGIVEREDLSDFLFGSYMSKMKECRSQENINIQNLHGPQLSYRSTQQSSNCTVVPPQLLPSSSVPHLAMFSNRSSFSQLPQHFINSPNSASIRSGIISSKSVNRLKCSPLRPQIQTALTSIVSSPQKPLNIILDAVLPSHKKNPPLVQNMKEIQKRAKLRCFLNPPLQRESMPVIEEPDFQEKSESIKEETQQNPFLMTQRLSLLSQHSKCLQNSQQDMSLHDTFLELIAEGGTSMNNSIMQIRLSNLSNSSPEVTLMKQGSLGSTGEPAPFKVMQAEDRMQQCVTSYINRQQEGGDEIEELKWQLIQLQNKGLFDIEETFNELSLGQEKTSLQTLQGTLLSVLDISLSQRELKLIFRSESIDLDIFKMLLLSGTSTPKTPVNNSAWQKLVQEVLKKSVKVEMDLEMLRFEMYSDLEGAYQAWVEVQGEIDYEEFVLEVSPKSYDV